MSFMQPNPPIFAPQASLFDKLLPQRLAATAKDLHASVKAPELMILTQALAMLSSLVMLRYRVESAPGLFSQTGLAVLVIADPNMLKSTIDGHLAAPVNAWQAAQQNIRKTELYDHKMAKARWKARVRFLNKKIYECVETGVDDEEFVAELGILQMQEPREPHAWLAQLTTGTFSGVSLVMSRQGSVFWNASDGGAALNAMTAPYTSQLADYWSGRSPTHVTRSYGVESASKVTFAASIAVQQKVFGTFYKSKTGSSWVDSGLLGRFLIAAPTSNIGQRLYGVGPEVKPRLDDWHKRITELLEQIFAEPNAAMINLTLSAEARGMLQSFRAYCETHSAPGFAFADIKNAAGKGAENAARVAAVYHVGEQREGEVIEADIMSKAIDTVIYSLNEHFKLFSGELQNMRIAEAADSLLRYLRRLDLAGTSLVPVSSVSKHGSKDLRDPNIRMAVVNFVFSMGWVLQGPVTPLSKTNIMLTNSGRQRADITKYAYQPVTL